MPGTHRGPLAIAREAHLWGARGALLEADGEEATVLTSSAPLATVAGLAIRRLAHPPGSRGGYGVWVRAGGLRLQGCDVSSASLTCVAVSSVSSDPLVVGCR